MRKEIYANIKKLAQEGIGVILISSDFEEIVALSDRVAIMYSERMVAELSPILPWKTLRMHHLDM